MWIMKVVHASKSDLVLTFYWAFSVKLVTGCMPSLRKDEAIICYRGGVSLKSWYDPVISRAVPLVPKYNPHFCVLCAIKT